MRVSGRSLFVFLIVCLLGVASAWGQARQPRPRTVDPSRCEIDPGSGLLAPKRAPGLCMQQTADGVLLTGATHDGLLIVQGSAPVEEGFLRIDDDEAQVVFCAASLIDAVTGRPGRECLVDAATLTPGAGAFVGYGHARIHLTVGEAGAAACPTSLDVAGPVASPAGDPFTLDGALALSRTEGGCTAVNDAVTLTYGNTTGALTSDPATSFRADLDAFEAELEERLRQLEEIDPARWELIDSLVRLGDDDWNLLQWMLSLDSAQLTQLGRFMESGGDPDAWGDLTLPAGSGFDRGGGGDVAVPEGIIQDIFGRIGTLLNRVSFSLPNNGPIRNLFKQIDVSVVIDLMTNVKDLIGGVISMLNEIRVGFVSWKNDACGPDCGVTDFKAKLGGMFTDLDGLWCDTQHLACMNNPELLEPKHLKGFRQGELFHMLLVEKPPPIFLYALKRVLDNVDGWHLLIANLRGQLPEALNQLCAGCTGCDCDGGESALLAMTSPLPEPNNVLPHEIVLCEALRPDVVGPALDNAIRGLGLAMFFFDLIEAWTPDNNTYGVEVTAVGGGGATLTIKNPPDGLAKSVNKVLKLFKEGIEQAKAIREACVKTENTIEAQLSSCSPPRQLFTQLIAFDDLAKMQYWVARWIGEALLNVDVHDEIDLTAASCFVERSLDVTKGRRARFTDLCDAYSLLVAGPVRQEACEVTPPEPEECQGGGGGGGGGGNAPAPRRSPR